MPTDVLTARAFITSFVLNPPVTTKPTGPDSLVRALRAYRTAVLRALGPRDQAGRLWAEMGEWHSVGRAPRAVRVRPREVALAAARRIQKGVLGAARPYDAEELVSFVWRRGHLQVRVLTLPCHIASRRSARRKRDCVLLSLLLQTSCWADMRLAAQNLARTAIGLVDTSPAASSPTRSTPSPSSPFAVRPCQPDSPVSFPLRVRTPPTLTRFQAELRDYPSRSSYPRAPAVEAAYAAFWQAVHGGGDAAGVGILARREARGQDLRRRGAGVPGARKGGASGRRARGQHRQTGSGDCAPVLPFIYDCTMLQWVAPLTYSLAWQEDAKRTIVHELVVRRVSSS